MPLIPRNTDVVYVAAEGSIWGPGGDRGLYKTTDGGKHGIKYLISVRIQVLIMLFSIHGIPMFYMQLRNREEDMYLQKSAEDLNQQFINQKMPEKPGTR